MKSMSSNNPDTDNFLDSSSATKLLNDMREKNMKLSTELERTKEKLMEREGDIEVLRQEKRDLVYKLGKQISTRAVEDSERENFISQLETLKEANAQLKFDLRTLVEDKSELFMEMEAYKAKAKRLQDELADATRNGQ